MVCLLELELSIVVRLRLTTPGVGKDGEVGEKSESADSSKGVENREDDDRDAGQNSHSSICSVLIRCRVGGGVRSPLAEVGERGGVVLESCFVFRRKGRSLEMIFLVFLLYSRLGVFIFLTRPRRTVSVRGCGGGEKVVSSIFSLNRE